MTDSWLTKRDGKKGETFYIRANVPTDIINAILGLKAVPEESEVSKLITANGKPRREIWKSLKTGDSQTAKSRYRTESALIEKLFTDVRLELAAEELDLIDDNRLFRVGQVVYAEQLQIRQEMIDEADDDTASIGEGFSFELDDWQNGLRGDGWSYEADDFIQSLLRKHGVILPVDTLAYHKARKVLGRAMFAAIRTAEIRACGDHGYVFDDPLATHTGPLPSPSGVPQAIIDQDQGITLKVLIDKYVAEKDPTWTGKTRDGYTVIFRALKEIMDEERRVKTIRREDCRAVRDTIAELPPNYTKRKETCKKTMLEAVEIGRKLGWDKRKPSTINSYMVNLSALFGWAVREEFMPNNPATNLLVANLTKPKDRKQPFSIDQLTTIFQAPLYTGCVDDERCYAKPGPNIIRHGRFWVPLLSLWTGMRLNECCQLHVADIKKIDGVNCIVVREDGEDGEDDKRVKSEAGERFVPVHPELERMGFMKYVAKMHNEVRLFPDLPVGSNGYYSDPFQKWFKRFLTKAGVTGNMSFHSYRHCYRDALREADISRDRVRALGGWSDDSTEEIYGSGFKASTLYQEISKVWYEGLDLSHLYEN